METLLQKLKTRYVHYCTDKSKIDSDLFTIIMLVLFRFNIVGKEEVNVLMEELQGMNCDEMSEYLIDRYDIPWYQTVVLNTIIYEQRINFPDTDMNFLFMQEDYLRKMAECTPGTQEYYKYDLLLAHLLGSRVILDSMERGEKCA